MSNKYSTTRVVIVLLAILSVVLAVVCVLKNSKNTEDKPQSDLSDYGNDIPSVDQGDGGLVFDDDGTVEMDSIPNDAIVSGGDAASASTSDAQ